MESVVFPGSTIRAQTYSSRPAVASFFEIAGRFLLFESPNGTLPPGLSELLGGFYFAPVEGATPDATIIFQLEDSCFAVLDGFDCFEISDGGRGYTDGGTCVFNFEHWRVVARADSRNRIEVLMRRQLDVSRPRELQVLNYAISAALRRCALYELHSGAVIEPRGNQGVLFVGPSGSGKSTLTLQLVASGWRYLTDDVLLLDKLGNSIEVHPLRRAFAITKATAVSASGVHDAIRKAFAADATDNSKRRFAPHEFFSEGFSPKCRPRAIFFPIITSENTSTVKKLTPAEGMTQLIKMCPWACYDRVTSAVHLEVLAALAKQCASFALFAGKDLLNDSTRAARLIQDQIPAN